ncbi:MAG: sulfotransferase family protein [Porticoccus sp.]|nr:MAG: sulfotransferase family protein [Porticoccus sp.]
MIVPDQFRTAWLSGMPRSGTTWLSQILASSPDVRLKSCPLFSYEFKNKLDKESSSEQWHQLFRDAYTTNSEFLDQEHLRKKGLIPEFGNKKEQPEQLVIKSNRFHNLVPYILENHEGIRFIYLVRHPCATIYSWLTDPNEFPKSADPKAHWRTGECRKTGPGEFWGFDDWIKVTKQALELSRIHPNRFRIFRYEDLVDNTNEVVTQIFNFLELSMTLSSESFICSSQSRHDEHKHSVFKNPLLINKWKESLDEDIISTCLRELEGTELEQFIL